MKELCRFDDPPLCAMSTCNTMCVENTINIILHFKWNYTTITMATEDETTTIMTNEEKIQAEIEKAKDMKISEMKMKLMAKGVLTSNFIEKDEFIRAYAEAMVKDAVSGTSSGLKGLTRNDNGDEEGVDEEGITEGLPPYIKLRVEKLKDINTEREELTKQYLAERAAMEAKFQQLSEPLYERRKEIILGKMDDEIASAGETEESGAGADGEEKDKGIPMFWACAIQQMPGRQPHRRHWRNPNRQPACPLGSGGAISWFAVPRHKPSS